MAFLRSAVSFEGLSRGEIFSRLFFWWFGLPELASLFVVLTLLTFYAHRENIKRLQAGTESKIGEK